MGKMVVQEGGWKLQPEKCPADVQFVEWASEHDLRGASVFHMGPGLHHWVGTFLGLSNYVFSPTICREEVESYMDMIEEDPVKMWSYHVEFLDIHSINFSKMPRFDIFTLFHLGEMNDSRRSKYAPLSIESFLESMKDRVSGPQSLVFGYSGSSAWDRAYPWLKLQFGEESFRFKSLVAWETK